MSALRFSHEEEFELLVRAKLKDAGALTELLVAYDPHVKALAKNRVKAYRVPERLREPLTPEVEQAGRLALTRVILDKFDLTYRNRLWTYAQPSVKGAMSDYLAAEHRRWRHSQDIEASGSDDEDDSSRSAAQQSQSSFEDAAVASVDWQTLMHQIIRLLGPQDGAKFISLCVCFKAEHLQWIEIVTMLNGPLEPEWFQWSAIHRTYRLIDDVPATWSALHDLFRVGQPRLPSSGATEEQIRTAANTLLKWFGRKLARVRRALGESWR